MAGGARERTAGWEDPGADAGLSCRGRGGLIRGGTGAARGSQAYLGPRALCRARRQGDRLGVLPPAGDAAAQSIQAVRLALRGRAGSG
jgi:hypothetical protein